MSRPLIFFFLIFAIVLGIHFLFPDLYLFIGLESIKTYHDKWVSLYEAQPVRIVFSFMVFNIIMAMLPVPGISMISFLGGSLFGFLPGALYSSVATALGNLGGFFLGRYFLREWVVKKYSHRIKVFEHDWQKKGAMALLSFRLFPFIPSFVANLIMGVSPLHWWTFFWVSWAGRIPMVLVYTYAGVEFAKISSVEDILHPKLMLAFILLAALPWALKYFKTRMTIK